MSANAASLYGYDLACLQDADALFSPAVGLAVVEQDAYHRITTDHVLGVGGDGWGYDVRRLLGKKQTELTRLGPVLAEVLTRDPRIQTADVRLTATNRRGLADVQITCTCVTEAGPFTFVKSVLDLTLGDLEGQQP